MPKPQSATKTARTRKKAKRSVPHAIVHVFATFNNTIITFTDPQGNAICWATAGGSGFRGSRKSTPFAAQVAAETAGKVAREEYGVVLLKEVIITGAGPGRDSSVRALITLGFQIEKIIEGTSVPFNGCRPRKKRRI
ncbi:MAG: 30S ribosomal protein S11 [Gammaproteobacteria bacterium]